MGSTMQQPWAPSPLEVLGEEMFSQVKASHELAVPHFDHLTAVRRVPRVKRTRDVPWGPPTRSQDGFHDITALNSFASRSPREPSFRFPNVTLLRSSVTNGWQHGCGKSASR